METFKIWVHMNLFDTVQDFLGRFCGKITMQYLSEEFFHGVILSQQVEDLILAVHRGLALTGAAEILGHLTWVVLILFKLPPLGQLHGGECYMFKKKYTIQYILLRFS